MANSSGSPSAYKNLPSVDELLRSQVGVDIANAAGHGHAADLARSVLGAVRDKISGVGATNPSKQLLFDEAVRGMAKAYTAAEADRLQKVINCTGVIIHTNLGRAPLSSLAKKKAFDHGSGYCTLEYDLDTGKRGKRAPRCERLLIELTGAEDALIVNNCAAAAFFVLSVFAAGCEVAISRGEMVEIGGDFRVPDVLTQSGASLLEVGTTNRTKLPDYAEAIEKGASVILRVHPSNYRIIGFTSVPALAELSELAHKHNVLLYEDIGSGALIDLAKYGVKDEPLIADSIAAGVDLVTFSGDKLLGGPQAGIIAGRGDLIDRLRSHPLYRALRVGKLVYSALESTLHSYRKGAPEELPVIAMLALGKQQIRERAEAFVSRFMSTYSGPLSFDLVDGNSAVGGGAAPGVSLETVLLSVSHTSRSAESLELSLRTADPPVIARIDDGRLLLDLRTVEPTDEEPLMKVLTAIS